MSTRWRGVDEQVGAVEPTRDRVLRAANRLFAEHGYARVSMREVAQGAGVTKPALYYHFRDKQALFEECLAADLQRTGAALAQAAADGVTLHQRVAAVARVLLTASPHHPVRMQSDIAEHVTEQGRDRLWASVAADLVRPVVGLFEQAASRGELREAVTPALAAATLLGLAMAFLPAVRADSAGLVLVQGDWIAQDMGDPVETLAELTLRGVASG